MTKMKKYYAYIALDGNTIVHPYNRLVDITSCYTSGSVIYVLPNEFEAKDHDDARQKAYKLIKAEGMNPTAPLACGVAEK